MILTQFINLHLHFLLVLLWFHFSCCRFWSVWTHAGHRENGFLPWVLLLLRLGTFTACFCRIVNEIFATITFHPG